jgi:hypothetical protein
MLHEKAIFFGVALILLSVPFLMVGIYRTPIGIVAPLDGFLIVGGALFGCGAFSIVLGAFIPSDPPRRA